MRLQSPAKGSPRVADNVVYQPFVIRTDYKVHPADGFVTTIIQSGTEATVQVSY